MTDLIYATHFTCPVPLKCVPKLRVLPHLAEPLGRTAAENRKVNRTHYSSWILLDLNRMLPKGKCFHQVKMLHTCREWSLYCCSYANNAMLYKNAPSNTKCLLGRYPVLSTLIAGRSANAPRPKISCPSRFRVGSKLCQHVWTIRRQEPRGTGKTLSITVD